MGNTDDIIPARFYTAREASSLLAGRGVRLSAKSLLKRAGTAIPAVRVGPNGGRVYFPGRALLEYLEPGRSPRSASAITAASPNRPRPPAPGPLEEFRRATRAS
ncbi:hypothetical protein [Tautonia marina]|uniref:hypothetical protein n=1 Tax=Tautonia marina TaxID=2653855 RepID=UPI0012613ACA|nr:hypothetical protein [Tautonia marina]